MILAQLADLFDAETWRIIYAVTLSAPIVGWLVSITIILIGSLHSKNSPKRSVVSVSIIVGAYYLLAAAIWWALSVRAFGENMALSLTFLLVMLGGPLVALAVISIAVLIFFSKQTARPRSGGFPV